MNKRGFFISYEDDCVHRPWKWVALLTFRGNPLFPEADRLFWRWIREIDRECSTYDFEWIRVSGRRYSKDRLRFCVLIGGLVPSPSGGRGHWVSRWQEIADDAGGYGRITNWLPDGPDAFAQEVHRLQEHNFAVDRGS